MKSLGLYFHIPFCSKACSYCNFYFSTITRRTDEFVRALILEIRSRSSLLNSYQIDTIYFGGGTPTVLTIEQWRLIFRELKPYLPVRELTIECNPEHVDEELVQFFQNEGVTRLSLGVQSLNTSDLQMMNRGHSPDDALRVLERVSTFSFDSWTVDLIYGVPHFEDTLNKISPWLKEIPHISSYALTVEPQTALHYQVQKKGLQLPSDTLVTEQYDQLCQTLASHDFQHYELSNFAKQGHHAVHNSKYWDMSPYIGFGPSAHSYVEGDRGMNEANYIRYISQLKVGKSVTYIQDQRSVLDEVNEALMVGLRTAQGVDLSQPIFAPYRKILDSRVSEVKAKLPLEMQEDRLYILPKNWMISDAIISDLFLDEDDL